LSAFSLSENLQISHHTISADLELAPLRDGAGSDHSRLLRRPELVHIRKALAKIRRHVYASRLRRIHHGVVRLVRLYDRSSRIAGAGDERSSIETIRSFSLIRSPHDG
jgi:hypothetical protein